jgi:hypothetical protein
MPEFEWEFQIRTPPSCEDLRSPRLTINFPAVADFYHGDNELVGFDLLDHAIIAHTNSIVRLLCMELLGAGRERVFPQTVNVLSKSLLDTSIKGGEIALSMRGKPDGIGHSDAPLFLSPIVTFHCA